MLLQLARYINYLLTYLLTTHHWWNVWYSHRGLSWGGFVVRGRVSNRPCRILLRFYQDCPRWLCLSWCFCLCRVSGHHGQIYHSLLKKAGDQRSGLFFFIIARNVRLLLCVIPARKTQRQSHTRRVKNNQRSERCTRCGVHNSVCSSCAHLTWWIKYQIRSSLLF